MRRAAVMIACGLGCGGPAKPAPIAPPAAPPAPAARVPADPPLVLQIDEVGNEPQPIALPAMPTLLLPATADGFVSLQALRVRKQAHLGEDVAVEGYVTYIYSCASIDTDPPRCLRPRFFIGADAGERAEAGLWVVEVPRAPNAIERRVMPKETLAHWPDVPKLALGDRVIVRGRFTERAPHGDQSSDGLVVYQAVEHVAAGAPPTSSWPLAPPLEPPLPLPPLPPPTAEAADRALGAACADAVKHAAPTDRVAAVLDACGRASAADPAQPIYHLWLGVALFQRATAAPLVGGVVTSHGPGLPMPPPPPVPTADELAPAREQLERALAGEPKLWRAPWLLGRVHAALGRDREAAAAYADAIYAAPRHTEPYVALAALYHRWHAFDEAIAVCTAGIAHATDDHEAALRVQRAQSLDARGDHDAARAELDEAMALAPTASGVLFQHGAWAFARGELELAARELAPVAGYAADRELRLRAAALLDRIAAAARAAPSP